MFFNGPQEAGRSIGRCSGRLAAPRFQVDRGRQKGQRAGKSKVMTGVRHYALLFLAAVLALPGTAAARESGSAPPPDLSDPPLVLPALRNAAASRGIRMDGFDPIGANGRLGVGDSVTALFTVYNGGRFRQWIAEMRVVEPTGAERRKVDDAVLYTQTGRVMHFSSGVAALRLRILGPIPDSAGDAVEGVACPEQGVRVTTHDALLRLGAEGMCRAVEKLVSRGKDAQLGFSTAPYAAKDIADAKRAGSSSGFTGEDETAFAQGLEALNEFTTNAENLPGVMGIAGQGIDWPSIWRMIREMNFAIWSSFDWKSLRHSNLPMGGVSLPVYHLPFRLYIFGSNVSQGGWFITAPRSPLIACGGVVGVWLQSIKHPENRMVMRLISAHRGGGN